MKLRHTFILNLKNLRKIAGLTQASLAERCGISANYLGQIEMGRRFPTIDLIEKIADILQAAPSDLFTPAQPDKAPNTLGVVRREILRDIDEILSRHFTELGLLKRSAAGKRL